MVDYKKLVENPKEFFTKLEQVAKRLGFPASWLADVIYIESKFKTTAKNPKSSATGLIQFVEKTAKGLGTTTSKLYKMSNLEQLDFVEMYFKVQIGRFGTPKTFFDAYCLVFYPVWANKPDTATLPPLASKANIGIDLNKDKIVSKGEFRIWAHRQVGRPLEEKKNIPKPKPSIPKVETPQKSVLENLLSQIIAFFFG